MIDDVVGRSLILTPVVATPCHHGLAIDRKCLCMVPADGWKNGFGEIGVNKLVIQPFNCGGNVGCQTTPKLEKRDRFQRFEGESDRFENILEVIRPSDDLWGRAGTVH